MARQGGMPSEAAGRPAPAAPSRAAVWAVRIAYAAVFVLNVTCALQFIFLTPSFAAAYELSGVPGHTAMRGLGIAFLMWNCTYPAVIASPRRFRQLGAVVLVQQLVGLVGETALLLALPAGHDLLASSILRFIAFDGGGLVVMAAAFAWLLVSARR